ncbi:hypothetical protein [Streptosporangium sp. NPDC049644]|uniref:hypothetical protein n=1 Tax=Streptosporangium sp. NPDC049644 TaxID=3155507 RepID=UPI003440ACCA
MSAAPKITALCGGGVSLAAAADAFLLLEKYAGLDRTAMRYVKPGAEAIAKITEILAPRRRTH